MSAALTPALLMLLHAVGEMPMPKGSALLNVTSFVGNPIIAMLLGAVFAVPTLSPERPEAVRKASSESIKPIAKVSLIIAGGGAFQQVPTDARVEERSCIRGTNRRCRL